MAATYEEIVKALQGSGLTDAQIQALASWSDFILNNEEAQANIHDPESDVVDLFQAALVGDPSPEAIALARAMADRAAETLAKGLDLSELKKLGESIAKAIEDVIHPHEAARRLEGVKGLDARRAATLRNYEEYLDSIDPALKPEEWERRREAKFQALLRDRKREIAQTEMRTATSTANQEKAAQRGATHQFWSSEGGPRVCPICRKNEAEGIVEFGHHYKASGGTHPPGHPGKCRCTMGYIFNEAQLAVFGPMVDDRIAATKAAIESGTAPDQRPPV